MHVPPAVRANTWWPRALVDQWTEDRRTRGAPPLANVTPGIQRVLDASAAFAHDPFQGVVERRVLDPALDHVDMEELAAREAIDRAGIPLDQIDVLLTHPVPIVQRLQNPACLLHERLGLSRACLAMYVEATAYTVFGQLALAEAAIAAGRARYALIVQSCTGTRLAPQDHPLSVVGGDAATALVLGPVDTGGVLALAHYTDGRYPKSLVLDGDRLIADAQQLFDAQVQTADVCKESVDAVLVRAGLTIDDIDFLDVFQGTAWLHRAVAEHIRLTRARSVEVFPRLGYLSAAAVPASLYIGQQAGLLFCDDVVLLTGGGTGMTYGAAVLQWGKA